MFGDKKIKIKDSERSLISETVSIEGTINSSGAIDVAGLVKGPVYSKELIVRDTGSITGTIEADDVEIYGHLDGKVTAQNVTGIKGGLLLCQHPTKKILLVNKTSDNGEESKTGNSKGRGGRRGKGGKGGRGRYEPTTENTDTGTSTQDENTFAALDSETA